MLLHFNPERTFKIVTHGVMLLAGMLLLSDCRDHQAHVRLRGKSMGTTWTLLVADNLPPAQAREVQTLIDRELQTLENEISHWQKDSDLSRWNRSSSTAWQTVPARLAEIVAAAKSIGNQTEGALDITVAPLVELWGFGPSTHSEAVPSLPEIEAVLQRVGVRHVEANPTVPALRKDRPDVQINVAAVAEGYAMDRLIAMLKEKGLHNFLFELGGEVGAIGHAPGGDPWQVGIQLPEADKGETLDTLPLTNLCVATSGTYRHRYQKNGHTFSHLIDPRTGRPVEHRLVAVSVIHEKCLAADGFATALMVLGPEKGKAVAQRLGLRVIWLEEPP
ncbi:MAG TPA: FAD:protein FMN transferase [Prosthecobacter sp.]